jgi:hypothetical protein
LQIMGGFMISRHENKIQEIKTFIETKYRGKCLSTDNDIINDSKILFECENKHQFKKSIRSIYNAINLRIINLLTDISIFAFFSYYYFWFL